MAQSYPKAIFGDVYLEPDTAASGGTLLEGVDPQRPIRVIAPHGLATEHHGLERDAHRSYVDPRAAAEPVVLIVPIAGDDLESIKLLFGAHTADGEDWRTHGDGVVDVSQSPPTRSLVVRPRKGSKHLYLPAAQLFEDSEAMMNWSPLAYFVMDDSNLVLMARRPEFSDVPGGHWGEPEDIDGLFDLPAGGGGGGGEA